MSVPHLACTLVLLPRVDWSPRRGDLHQVGVWGHSEGLHTVGDLTGGQGGVRPPRLVPQTPPGSIVTFIDAKPSLEVARSVKFIQFCRITGLVLSKCTTKESNV